MLTCFESEDPVRDFEDEAVARDFVAPVGEFVRADYGGAVGEDGVDGVAEGAAPEFSWGVFFE